MALAFTSLPQDVLILVFMHLLVEDVLALMQVIRGVLDTLYLTRNADMSRHACTRVTGLFVALAPRRLGHPLGHLPGYLPYFSLKRFSASSRCQGLEARRQMERSLP